MGAFNIPAGATIVNRISGIIEKPDAWTHGRRVTVTHWRDFLSKGWRSDYQAVETHFISYEIEGEKKRAWRYTGRRLGKAAEHFESAREIAEYFRKAE